MAEAVAQIAYEELTAAWRTPRGREAVFAYRGGTNDWNVISSVLNHDEYGLADLHLTGLAIDIGAHLGAVTVGLALDNPDLSIIAVEAIGENTELCQRNVDQNGLRERVTVFHRAAGALGQSTAHIQWRGTGSENATHHAFIGNSTIVPWTGTHRSEMVDCISLSSLAPAGAAFLKIDCEGCEWDVLRDPAIARIGRIHGEWHPTDRHTRGDLSVLLAETHDVTFSGPDAGPGGFVAVLR